MLPLLPPLGCAPPWLRPRSAAPPRLICGTSKHVRASSGCQRFCDAFPAVFPTVFQRLQAPPMLRSTVFQRLRVSQRCAQYFLNMFHLHCRLRKRSVNLFSTLNARPQVTAPITRNGSGSRGHAPNAFSSLSRTQRSLNISRSLRSMLSPALSA